MKRLSTSFCLLLFLLSSAFSGSFLSLNSFGKLNYSGDIRSMSMASSGIALYDDRNSSSENPAVITAGETIVLNIGETYSSLSISYDRFSDFEPDTSDFDTPYINIIFPLPWDGLYLSANYSSPVNSMIELEYVSEGEEIDEVHEKNINLAGFNASYKLPFGLSLSAGVLYAFGNERNEYSIINDAYPNESTYNKWKYTYSGLGSKFGLLMDVGMVNIGLKYQPSFDVEVARSFNDVKVSPHTEFTYPDEFSAGISLYIDSVIMTSEYASSKWSGVDYYGYSLEDMTRFSVGAEYVIKIPYERRGKDRLFSLPFRAGYYNQKGYYNDGRESALSCGFSLFPFKKSTGSRMDVLFSYGVREATLNDGFDGGDYGYEERFFTFGMAFAATDKWFR